MKNIDPKQYIDNEFRDIYQRIGVDVPGEGDDGKIRSRFRGKRKAKDDDEEEDEENEEDENEENEVEPAEEEQKRYVVFETTWCSSLISGFRYSEAENETEQEVDDDESRPKCVDTLP